MEDEAIITNEEWKRQWALRVAKKNDANKAGEGQESIPDLSSEEESEKRALNIMTAFDIAGDALGWVPFLGGIIRFITGVGAFVQSFKINITVQLYALGMNGIIALLEVMASFFGANELPLQSVCVLLIRVMANNAAQKNKLADAK